MPNSGGPAADRLTINRPLSWLLLPVLVLLFSCQVNDRVALRPDDILAAAGGRTIYQMERRLQDKDRALTRAMAQKDWQSAAAAADEYLAVLDTACGLAFDKDGSFRSPTMFTPGKKTAAAERFDTDALAATAIRTRHTRARLALTLGDIHGFGQRLEQILADRPTGQCRTSYTDTAGERALLRETFLFALSAGGRALEAGRVDEAVAVVQWVRTGLNRLMRISPAADTTAAALFWPWLDAAAACHLAEYYFAAGDKAGSGNIVRAVAAAAPDATMQVRALTLLARSEYASGQNRPATMYLNRALEVIFAAGEAHPGAARALLEAATPRMFADCMTCTARLTEAAEAGLAPVRSPDDPQVMIPGRPAAISAAWIFEHCGLRRRAKSLEAEFVRDLDRQGLMPPVPIASYVELLVQRKDWPGIVATVWPLIDRLEFTRYFQGRSRYRSLQADAYAIIYKALALALLHEKARGASLPDHWPAGLGLPEDHFEAAAFRPVLLAKSLPWLNPADIPGHQRRGFSRSLAGQLNALNEKAAKLSINLTAGYPDGDGLLHEIKALFQDWRDCRQELTRFSSGREPAGIFAVKPETGFTADGRLGLEYAVSGNTVMRFRIAGGKVTAVILAATRDETRADVKKFRRLCLDSEPERLPATARKIAADILQAPHRLDAGIRYLALAPDDALTGLPFPALLEYAGFPDMSSLALVLTPSLLMHPSGRGHPPDSKNKTALLAGDPLPLDLRDELSFGGQSSREILTALRAISVQSTSPPTRPPGSPLPWTMEAGQIFQRLPFTDEEIREIAALLEQDGYQTRSLLRTRFTRHRLEQALATPPFIAHFATHAVVTGEVPYIMEPALLLSAGNHFLDAFWTAREIEARDFSRTGLVVLSACQTGIDRLYGHGGVSGLAGAFMAAGARNIIVSLWHIDDAATTVFMKQLYTELGRGLSIHEAFPAARKTLMRSSEYFSPFYWAGFALYGSGADAR